MASIYLETSFFSACVSDRDDPGSLYRGERSREWWTTQRQQHRLWCAPEVLAELGRPGFRHRKAALSMAGMTEVIGISPAVRGLATILVREKVMPGPADAGDAIHVAAATVNDIAYLLSWNIRHLANPNKLHHLRTVCLRAGYLPPVIVTPESLWAE